MSGEGTCIGSCKLTKYVGWGEPCTERSMLNKFEHVRGARAGTLYREGWVLRPVQKGRPGLGLALPLSSGQTDTIKNITFVTWLAGVNNVVVLDDKI